MQEVIGSTPICSTNTLCLSLTSFIVPNWTDFTSDLDKRLAEHNSGLSHFTSNANDWVIKYRMLFDSRTGAEQRSGMRFLLKRKKAESLFSSSSKMFRAPKGGHRFDSDMLHFLFPKPGIDKG